MSRSKASAPTVSVIVPVLNEAENVPLLVDAVRQSLEGRFPWELIVVDDHSTDRTPELVKEIAGGDPRVRLIRLARWYGQSTAMQAGFDHARGDVVVTMDGDLQNDPADIPLLVSELDSGFDLVTGYRQNRQDRVLSRKVPSWIANRIIAAVTGVPVRDNGCSLKAYRKELLARIRLYSDMHRFIPTLAVGMAGARISEVPVRHHARKHGQSKYNISRTAKVLADLLTIKMIRSFRLNPLRLFGGAAFACGAVSTVFTLAAIHVNVDSPEPGLIVFGACAAATFALAAFLLLVGLIGEVAVRRDYVTATSAPHLAMEIEVD
ncbi:MAG: glycosyltransferase family 2 protein [Gemmatimonadota bacterium]|nr:glycosyltransferase family 2 protein [Gemmatimonadota bacterium]